MKINGEGRYLWRAIDHEGEVLESYVTRMGDRKAALQFLKNLMRWQGRLEAFVTDKLRSCGAAIRDAGNVPHEKDGRWINNRAENSHQPFRPPTLRSIAISTPSAVSRAELTSRQLGPLHSPNGGRSVLPESA